MKIVNHQKTLESKDRRAVLTARATLKRMRICRREGEMMDRRMEKKDKEGRERKKERKAGKTGSVRVRV
jgi:hypothetical protein